MQKYTNPTIKRQIHTIYNVYYVTNNFYDSYAFAYVYYSLNTGESWPEQLDEIDRNNY